MYMRNHSKQCRAYNFYREYNVCHEVCYSLIPSCGNSIKQEKFLSLLQMRKIVITYCQRKILLEVIKEDLNKKKKIPWSGGGRN